MLRWMTINCSSAGSAISGCRNNPLLKSCISRLTAELARRGLKFRPHFWLAEEWFSPDGIPASRFLFIWRIRASCSSSGKLMGEVEAATKTG